ncbi:MAG TPA: hypothetical protein VHN14_32870 [Kofleriaceae bacterium]|jgi:hypothetical protein|nr:hypothetical protein [Kofleriaceae bacterium]
MLRNTTLATFLVTVAIVVPAGWHALGADIQTDGKRLRPLQQSVMVDGARVTLDVDREVVMTGDTVKARLVAFSDTPKQVKVDLRVLHTSNYEGERVEQPWTPIDRETITLTAAPRGGKPFDTALTLGTLPDRPALTDSFKIYVSAHGQKPPKREYNDSLDYDVGVSEGRAAAIAITGWSGNNLHMSIKPEGRPTSDAPFTVAVKISNTSGQPLAHLPYITLSTEAALGGSDEEGREEASVALEKIEADDEPSGWDTSFARGKSMVARFRVTPHQKGLRKITFLASAFEYEEAPGPVTAGAMDARTITLSEANPSVAAK